MYKFYLSMNNNEVVILLPVSPSEFSVSSPQSNEVFSTLNGELNIPGNMGLRTISFSSIFPMKAVSFSLNKEMFGFEFVELIEDLRKRKQPFRLVVTNTNINMAVTLDAFEYSVARGDYVRYSMTLKEFKFI